MDSGYTSWTIEDFNTALARKYATDRPVMAPWRREAAEAANVAAKNMPVHDVFTGRSARAAKARQALCEGRQAMGWHPWTIARYYGIAPEMVSEALGEDGAPEWLELQETLTRRRRRTPGPSYYTVVNGPDRLRVLPPCPTFMINLGLPVLPPWPPSDCQCRRCDPGLGPSGLPERFIVCGTCGNKRCPHAEWHGYECSGSNEVGQTPKPVSAVELAALKVMDRGGSGADILAAMRAVASPEALAYADAANEQLADFMAEHGVPDFPRIKLSVPTIDAVRKKWPVLGAVRPNEVGQIPKTSGVDTADATECGSKALGGRSPIAGVGLEGPALLHEMIAGLMKAGGKDDGQAEDTEAQHSDGRVAYCDGNEGHRCGAEADTARRDGVEPRGGEGVAGTGVAVDERGGPVAGGIAETEAQAETPQVAALKAEIERLKAELAAKGIARSIEDAWRGYVVEPCAPKIFDPVMGAVRDATPEERIELGRVRPVVQESITNATPYPMTVASVDGEDVKVGPGETAIVSVPKRPKVIDAPKAKTKAERDKERKKRKREKPLAATVAERAATKIVKAKKPKAMNAAIEFKDAEVDPKVLEGVEVYVYTEPKPEPKPPVRMVPLPRRPAGAARCDCGLAVQHTGSDGVGRCTRCATEAYRMKQGAAE